MTKRGYLLRLVMAMGLMGAGMILGWSALIDEAALPLIVGYFVFGSGAAITAYTETKRLFQQGMG